MISPLASRRAELTQLFVYMPPLRSLLRAESVPSATAARLAALVQDGDRELAGQITDAEIAAARRSAAGRFADVFPAGI